MSDKPTLIDLFAGCGGLTQGFVAAGFEPVLAVEFDRSAAATYAANFGDIVHVGDIAALDLDTIEHADVVVGGPPCQGFSGLGLRDPTDPRNKLWRYFLEVVRRAEPDVFVIENVARFRQSDEYGLLMDILRADGLGAHYDVWAGELSAEDYGVPQRRRRAFVIGSRRGTPFAPTATHSRRPAPDKQLDAWVTIRQAFTRAGVPLAPSGIDLPARLLPADGIGRSARIPGVFSGLEIHLDRRYEARSIERYRYISPGGNRHLLPEDLLFDCWKKKRTGTTDVLGRLLWDEPSVTIRTEFFKPEKGRYLHPQWDQTDPAKSQDRALTLLEGAVLQSFPMEFKWCGSKVQIGKQIGNAVPPELAEQIARQCVLPLLGLAPMPSTVTSEPAQLELLPVAGPAKDDERSVPAEGVLELAG